MELIEAIKKSQSTFTRYWLSQLSRLSENSPKHEILLKKINYELENIKKRSELISQTKISYPEELPVSREVTTIKEIIAKNQVTIVCGETGSGKTTQLPKILLDLGLGKNGVIGHTQPRRIAAKSLASRIASELGNENNTSGLVGYKMRFHDKTERHTAIKLMTDGILLQEIQQDKLLLQYSALIIDEVHERSLNIDFILGYLKGLLAKRDDLKIVITSATIENEKLSKFFNNAPVINVSGKTYPVDIIYQPLDEDKDNLNIHQGIYQAICALLNIERGNGLIFLPGEREIKDCLSFLRKTELKHYELLPLYSRQSNEEQAQIFNNNGKLKIILATNIAETSLTIPGIKFVIDTGIARVKRYSVRNRVEQLQIETVSQASSRQRAGRAGRISHGICVRLFSEDEFKLRKEFTEPELLRSNLANVILKLLSLNLGDPTSFQFLDMPENKAFNDGFRTLFQVGAIDEDNQITPIGRKLANIPLDIQLARVLVAAAEKYNCLAEALVICSFLAIQDPREYPLEHQQLSAERHSIWADKDSEFNLILNLWQWYHNELAHKKSNRKLLEVCHKQFVSLLRLKEWHELHRQLKEVMLGHGYKANQLPASYQELHLAILTGFVVNIGQKDLVENHYQGTNSKKFYLHPSVKIASSKWVVAASLVETSRLYARNAAKIETEWLNGIANHLYKYTYHGEQWDKKRGEVTAIKSAMLYGLLISQVRVSISKINPELTQEIFIKEGLVQNQLNKRYSFIEHNLRVVKELEKLEDKLRTSLAILDDELYDFYAKRLPKEVLDIRSLEEFLKTSEASLKINQAEFIERLTRGSSHVELFPDSLLNNGQRLKVKYIFDHESQEDGLVVILELAQVPIVNAEFFDWLVPGMIREKLSYMIKALPKNQRLQFNPLQESITEFLETSDSEKGLISQFIEYASNYKRLTLDYLSLINIKLPTQYYCHFRVMDQKKVIASGDDLAKIKRELAPQLNKMIVKHTSDEQIANVTGYIPEFSKLLALTSLNAGKQQINGYFSLIIEKDASVSFGVLTDLEKARISTRRGLTNLIKLHLKDQLKYLQSKKINKFAEVSLALMDVYSKEELSLALCNYILNMAINNALGENIPKTQDEFDQLVKNARINVSACTTDFTNVITRLAENYQEVKLRMAEHPLAEILEWQLDDLIYPQFLNFTKWQYLSNYPRYLQAMLVRIDKYAKSRTRDEGFEDEVRQLYDQWYNYVDELENKHKVINSELYDFKFKIEELRISLFAQELRTLYPVSVKRLTTELNELYQKNLKA